MGIEDLRLALVQTELHWENIDKNIEHFSELLKGLENVDVVILPEMFTTGFTMSPASLAENMEGKAVSLLKSTAVSKKVTIMGSFVCKQGNGFSNRMVVASPDGNNSTYDKRHLFRMAQENESFSMGNSRTILELKGWRLMLQVCYDLRFPVFARNTVDAKGNCAYDAVIYIANWPEKRNFIWKNLIQARAIENQAYCIGLNRVGVDGNEINYSGDSRLIDPWGKIITELEAGKQQVASFVLVRKVLEEVRKQFPAFLDSDQFLLIKESTNPTFQ